MFARIKKSGKNQYLQIVENRREVNKAKQRVVSTIGRLDGLQAKRDIETLVRSLSRFSEKVLLILSDRSDVTARGKKIGPVLIFERLWKELGIGQIIDRLLRELSKEGPAHCLCSATVLWISGGGGELSGGSMFDLCGSRSFLALHHGFVYSEVLG